jgi:exonuclease SbcC
MRIRSVTAHAFGPLRGETLSLADGMTVVVGVNESAKTSWHAAIFAGVCGRRRGRGQPRKDEQEFADLHKPWDGDEWLVTAEVGLDDGRRIELRHDLAGRVDCHARDLDLGQDISAEVMNDGAPDGARWLGLDRSSFVATACVAQAEMMRVRSDAEGLQEHLQRAAATAGTDATAAAGLDRLDDFQREHVGLDRANSTKPLRRALLGKQIAESNLEAARRAHEEYLSRVAEVDELRQQATTADEQLRAYEAAAARHHADRLAERWSRAQQLQATYGDTPPATVSDDDALASQVTAALTAWSSRPTEPTPGARTASDVQAELDTLPAAPDGDLEVHRSVQDALDRAREASTRLETLERNRPKSPAEPPTVAAGDEELLDLARTLETPLPSVPEDLIRREGDARIAMASSQKRVRWAARLLLTAAVAVLIGIGLFAVTAPPIGGAAIAVGVALLVAAALARRGSDDATMARRLAAEEATLRAEREKVAEATDRRNRAVTRCGGLGLAPDPVAIRHIPVVRAQAVGYSEESRRWSESREELREKLSTAAGELAGALAARGEELDGAPQLDQLLAAVERYRAACRTRATQAAAAARRPGLETELGTRRAAEERANLDQEARANAEQVIVAAAFACGLPPGEPTDCAAALQGWSDQRGAKLDKLSEAQQDWAELQALLDGSTPDELEQVVEAAADKATQLAAGLDPDLLASVDPATAADALPDLRAECQRAHNAAASKEGELRLFAGTIPSVPEAEEAYGDAVEEMDRVHELRETLELTRGFLSEAQTRVHRSIAPVLASTVRQWLPQITAGRYTDVSIDPTTLRVDVCGESRRWRNADLLSYGTAEQVYLLLRIALADHLTNGHDTCPLILDDVTVHADPTRSQEILDLLLRVSACRQVILFTQEAQVAAWARENLTGPEHAVRELAPVTTV